MVLLRGCDGDALDSGSGVILLGEYDGAELGLGGGAMLLGEYDGEVLGMGVEMVLGCPDGGGLEVLDEVAGNVLDGSVSDDGCAGRPALACSGFDVAPTV